jgi:PPOX class probable F420-dependent enzyme
MDLFYPLMERGRHRKAVEIAEQTPTAPDFEALQGARQALIVSFKRTGEPVPTVVNCAISEDGALYFRSEPQTAKIRRIAANSRVLVGPCSLRGKPRGALAEGHARVLPEADSDLAYKLIRQNWSAGMWPGEMTMDRLGVSVVYVEVRSGSNSANGAASTAD